MTLTKLNIISINIEGFSDDKAKILSQLYRDTNCDIMCVQETHRGPSQSKPQIPDLMLVLDIPHPKYGSAIFAKPTIPIVSKYCNSDNSIETITINTGDFSITSIYKPPKLPFVFTCTENYYKSKFRIIIGDFNSHSTQWGYRTTNRNGKMVKIWAEDENLVLLHDGSHPGSFLSNRYKTEHNPDLLFVSAIMAPMCRKEVGAPITKTQHRPIFCKVYEAPRQRNAGH